MKNIQRVIQDNNGYKCVYVDGTIDIYGFDGLGQQSKPFDVIAWHVMIDDQVEDIMYTVIPITAASFSADDMYVLVHPDGCASIKGGDEVYPSIESAMDAWRNSIATIKGLKNEQK